MIQYIRQFGRLLYTHLRYTDTSAMEIFPGVLLTLTGIWLTLPNTTALFRYGNLIPVYHKEVWLGSFMILAGILTIHSVLFKIQKLRKLTTMFRFVIWSFLAMNEFLIWPTPFYGIIFATFALNGVWLYIRIGVLYDLDNSGPNRISTAGNARDTTRS